MILVDVVSHIFDKFLFSNFPHQAKKKTLLRKKNISLEISKRVRNCYLIYIVGNGKQFPHRRNRWLEATEVRILQKDSGNTL